MNRQRYLGAKTVLFGVLAVTESVFLVTDGARVTTVMGAVICAAVFGVYVNVGAERESSK